MAAQGQHRDARQLYAQPLDDGTRVGAGQVDVDHDDVGPDPAGDREDILVGGDVSHDGQVALVRQHGAQRGAQ
ncbi:hypothetical protein Prum_081190 [Phytohabitans rumicis]|uniref:Uncharacterized protein n=1 Tax=Phytohabitans rumicis TaxID=1076125 RepID=A0A6V8LK80_9ACTN|nr:hypothetical protein Prum_081190 [Phytohabitans rumicis]